MEKKATNPTAHVTLETRWANKKGNYKIKLMVTYKREQKFFRILIPGMPNEFTIDIFKKIKSDKPRSPFNDYADKITNVEATARAVIKNMDGFTFEEFEKKFFDPSKEEINLFTAIQNYVDELKEQKRASTSSSYNCTLQSMKKYATHKNLKVLQFDDLTIRFLKDYEKWMLADGNNLTTVGIYLRNVRAILNKAIKDGLFKLEKYPFGRDKYQIPAGSNVKKALALAEVGKIYNYQCIEGSSEQRYKDYWVFSYLCNGINIKDIARLKYKNIDEEVISFIRAKTENRNRGASKHIVVPLTQQIKQFIARWGNQPPVPDNYVFPILKENFSPEQELAQVRQTVKMINKYVRRVAEAVGITKRISTYTARHSFATVLKRSGASLEFISESLGHSNLMTTESYLSSFEIDTKVKYAEQLTNFE